MLLSSCQQTCVCVESVEVTDKDKLNELYKKFLERKGGIGILLYFYLNYCDNESVLVLSRFPFLESCT